MDKQSLIDALEEVVPSVATSAMTPIHAHFWFTGKRLMGFNTHIAISVPFKTEFQGAVPRTLLDILKTVQAKDIEFDPSETELRVKGVSAKFKLATMPPEDFTLQIPKPQESEPMPIDARRFMQAMQQCMMSIGNDTGHPDYLGVTLINDRKANRLLLFSTDRETISHGSTPIAKGKELDFDRVILKTEFCQQLLRIGKGATKIRLEIGEDYAAFREGGIILFGGMEATDPNQHYDFVAQVEGLAGNAKQHMARYATKFEACLQRACIITDASVDRSKMEVSVKNSRALLRAKSERGETEDSVPLGPSHPDVVSHVDPKRLLSGVGRFSHIKFTKEYVAMMNVPTPETPDAKHMDDLIYLVSAAGH